MIPDLSAGQPLLTGIKDLNQKISDLCTDLGGDFDRIECEPLDGTIEDGECVEIPNPLASLVENNAGIIDEKIIAFVVDPSINYTVNGGADNPDSVYVGWEITITCGGNVVHTHTSGNNQPLLVEAFVDCPRNAPIEICFDAIVRNPQLVQSISASTRFCGAMLCIGRQTRELTGLFKPPEIPEGCCYARESLCLASQNLDALCLSLIKNRSQFAYCVEGASDDIDNVLIASNVPAGTQFYVWGEVFLCFRNDQNDADWNITATPIVTCGDQTTSCISLNESVSHGNDNNPQGLVVCRNIPVITCGTCAAGDDIEAGFNYDRACLEDGLTIEGGGQLEIVSVEQRYCVWLFSDVEITNLPPVTDLVLGKCVTDTDLEPLVEKCTALQTVIDNFSSVNSTKRDIAPLSGVSPQSWLLQQALPWPPPTPPPRPVPDPPPEKKWNLNVQVCSSLPDAIRRQIIASQRAVGTLTFEIKCGGTALISRKTNWLMYQIGGSENDQFIDLRPQCLGFTGCFTCDISEDLEICGEFEINLNNANIIVQANVDLTIGKAFCF